MHFEIPGADDKRPICFVWPAVAESVCIMCEHEQAEAQLCMVEGTEAREANSQGGIMACSPLWCLYSALNSETALYQSLLQGLPLLLVMGHFLPGDILVATGIAVSLQCVVPSA